MPREALHWYVALQALKSAQNTGVTIDRNAYLLGAMAPDAGYFYLSGKSDNHFPEKLHGKDGEDTWAPVRAAYEKAKNDRERSFVLGYISHVVTDATFHPTVYFLTGNYYDTDVVKREKAVQQHRLIETRLDSWIRKRVTAERLPKYVKDLWDNKTALKELCALFATDDFLAEQLEESFIDFGSAQKLFLSSAVGFCVRIGVLFIPKLRQLDALFSFGRWGNLEVFEERFSSRHPVTGEELREISWRTLLEDALRKHQEVFSIVKSDIQSKRPLLKDTIGPSLNFGIPNCPITKAKYFL